MSKRFRNLIGTITSPETMQTAWLGHARFADAANLIRSLDVAPHGDAA